MRQTDDIRPFEQLSAAEQRLLTAVFWLAFFCGAFAGVVITILVTFHVTQ